MTRLTEDMVIARTKSSDMATIKKLNCWGSDLEDVSLVRRFTNVEVLSLSLNHIKTLSDFQYCSNLVELYVRRNCIACLTEVCYLRELPRLRRLLLAENPCVDSAGVHYRSTVLRCLPNLEVLDNQQVGPEEVEMAMKVGLILEHPMERTLRDRCSPEPTQQQQYYREDSPPRTQRYEFEEFRQQSNHSPPAEFYYNGDGGSGPKADSPPNANLTKSNPTGGEIDANGQGTGQGPVPRSPREPPRRIPSPDYPEPQQQQQVQSRNQQNGRRPSSDYISDGHGQQQGQFYEEHRQVRLYRPSSKQAIPPPPRTKSSNILSAMLCLLPELDLPSLEVLELTVRRRMDEFGED